MLCAQVQEAMAQVVELRQAIRDFQLDANMAKAILLDALRAERLSAAASGNCVSPEPITAPTTSLRSQDSSLVEVVTALANLHLSLQVPMPKLLLQSSIGNPRQRVMR